MIAPDNSRNELNTEVNNSSTATRITEANNNNEQTFMSEIVPKLQ